MVGSEGRRWKKLGDVTLGRGYAEEGVAGKQRQQHYFVRQCCDRGGSDVDVWGMVGERREEVEDGGSGRQRRARLQQREEEVEEATVRVWRPLAVHWQGLVGDSGREAREEGSIVGYGRGACNWERWVAGHSRAKRREKGWKDAVVVVVEEEREMVADG
ncbi:hypothetical protein GW17_00051687 [Ensete ventricosum]|nr:hypothetical protein GW17_00051687 [Ensete ventricosum]